MAAEKKPKKILIIEDEKELVKALEVRFKRKGYRTAAAYDGEDGLRMAREEKPDLIMLDLMLPKMEGFKLSRLLKFDWQHKDIPVIMLTARDNEEDKTLGMETGADEYITKPFEWDDLFHKMDKYLRD